MTMNTALPEPEMVRLWELHTQLEFATKDAAATVATMTPDNYVNHVPVMTGGRGRDAGRGGLVSRRASCRTLVRARDGSGVSVIP